MNFNACDTKSRNVSHSSPVFLGCQKAIHFHGSGSPVDWIISSDSRRTVDAPSDTKARAAPFNYIPCPKSHISASRRLPEDSTAEQMLLTTLYTMRQLRKNAHSTVLGLLIVQHKMDYCNSGPEGVTRLVFFHIRTLHPPPPAK